MDDYIPGKDILIKLLLNLIKRGMVENHPQN